MATDETGAARSKKRKQYLLHNRPVKKKGSYPLRPGVEGFFITCDGGRERQASREAINVIDSFFEELVDSPDSTSNPTESASKPLNKKITFKYSDSSDSEDEDDGDDDEDDGDDDEKEANVNSENNDSALNEKSESEIGHGEKSEQLDAGGVEDKTNGASEPPSKRQCPENDSSKCSIPETKENKSIDKLIEDEIRELGDKSKVKLNALMLERRFASLDSGCNGVIFVQMRRQAGDPGPKEIVQHIMTSAASTRKHMSRFILRILPVELACYASEEEISKAIEPLVCQHFPAETESPLKFAVLYDARANTGIDRMKIINSVAKSIPEPHKVNLNNPDKSIVVQIVKTTCLIGVVEKYKELAKYNLRQLTSQKT